MARAHSPTALARRTAVAVDDAVRANPLGASLVLVGAALLVFLLCAYPRLQTNDDHTMQWIANGFATADGPSGHLVFTNVLVGAPVAFLYRLAPGVPWYAGYLLAVEALAAVVLTYVVLSRERFRAAIDLPLVIGLLATLFWATWLELQFTVAAFLVGFAGLALHLARSRLEATPTSTAALAGALCGATYLVRINSALGLAALAAPVLVLTARRIPVRKQVAFGVAALAVAGAGMLATALTDARHPEWRDYRELNSVRGRLHDTPELKPSSFSLDPGVLDEAGWTGLEYNLFVQWQLFDQERYTPETLRALRRALPDERRDLGDELDPAVDDVRWMLPLLAAALVGGALTLPRRDQLALVGLAAWTGGVLVYLAVELRLPERVSVPMVAFVPILALTRALATEELPPSGRRAGRAVGVAVAVVALVSAVVGIDRTLTESARQHVRSDAAVARIESVFDTDPTGLYLVWANTLGQDRLSAFHEVHPEGVTFVPAGWIVQTPHQRELLERTGEPDVYRALLERDDAYVVFVPDRGAEGLLRSLYADWYDVEVSIEPVEGWGGNSRIRVATVERVR